jgi:hypothetical protein
MAYNFHTRNSKIKQRTEYEGVTRKVLLNNVILTALMSRRKYDIVPQNGNCSGETSVCTLVFL